MSGIVLTRNAYRQDIPLGLVVLKSYLDQTPHQSWIHDLCLPQNDINSLESLVSEKNVDFVGISVGTITSGKDIELAKRLKSRFGVKIIIGGAFANAPSLFDGVYDYKVVGRGEEKLLAILDQNMGVTSSPQTNFINTDLVDFQSYKSPRDRAGNKQFPLHSSFGCKFTCLYCSIPSVNENKVWFKDPSLLLREIEELAAKGIKRIRFVDDLFGMDKNKTYILLKSLSNLAGLELHAQLRVDCASDELLTKMRTSGFSGIYLGIESSNENTLRLIRKPYTKSKIEHVVEKSYNLGFSLTGAFTIGYPWESRQDILDTFEFAKKMHMRFDLKPSIYVVTPFPGTPLHSITDPKRIRETDYSLWDAKHAVMDTKHLTKEDIQKLFNSFKSD